MGGGEGGMLCMTVILSGIGKCPDYLLSPDCVCMCLFISAWYTIGMYLWLGAWYRWCCKCCSLSSAMLASLLDTPCSPAQPLSPQWWPSYDITRSVASSSRSKLRKPESGRHLLSQKKNKKHKIARSKEIFLADLCLTFVFFWVPIFCISFSFICMSIWGVWVCAHLQMERESGGREWEKPGSFLINYPS